MHWSTLDHMERSQLKEEFAKDFDQQCKDIERAAASIFKLTAAGNGGGLVVIVGAITKLISDGKSVEFLVQPFSVFAIGFLFALAAATTRYFYFIAATHHLGDQWTFLIGNQIELKEYCSELPGRRKWSWTVRVFLACSAASLLTGLAISVIEINYLH